MKLEKDSKNLSALNQEILKKSLRGIFISLPSEYDAPGRVVIFHFGRLCTYIYLGVFYLHHSRFVYHSIVRFHRALRRYPFQFSLGNIVSVDGLRRVKE